MKPIVRLIVCCNDGQGNDTGRVSAIHFYEEDERCVLIELEHDFHCGVFQVECPPLPLLIHDEGARLLQVGERSYDLHSNRRATNVGNVYWDAFLVEESVARQLATDLLRSGEWYDTVSTEGWFWDLKTGDWKDA